MITATTQGKYYSKVYGKCEGPCQRYKGTKKGYTDGQKRCSNCDIFIKWDGAYCPCCSIKLRTRSRKPIDTDYKRY